MQTKEKQRNRVKMKRRRKKGKVVPQIDNSLEDLVVEKTGLYST
jgi:hypothetical protein